MRSTRFELIILGVVLGSCLIILCFKDSVRLLLLSLLISVSGLIIGLGVSFPQWRLFGESLCRVATTRLLVALTFDDGPDPAATPVLLDLLSSRGVRATFFCIGERVARHRDLVVRMAAAGHQIENHTHCHSHLTNLLPVARLRSELAMAQETIHAAIGRAPLFLRPPMCLTNPRIFRVAQQLNLTMIGYTARGFDKRSDTPERIVQRLLSRLSPGAILLLHDGGVPADRLLTVATMLLDQLETLGYHCVRLDELISHAHKS